MFKLHILLMHISFPGLYPTSLCRDVMWQGFDGVPLSRQGEVVEFAWAGMTLDGGEAKWPPMPSQVFRAEKQRLDVVW